MTAEQYIEKFGKRIDAGEIPVRENCLQDMACPECGQRGPLRIAATIVATVFDDGTDRDESDCEWDGKSRCSCEDCGHEGTVDDFTIEGLDDELYQMSADE